MDWSDDIVLVDFSDEPEFSEEMSALYERLKISGSESTRKSELELKPAADISGRRDAAGSAATPHIVLNFSSVSYLNSSHLAALLRLRKRVAEGGGRLVLCALNDNLRDVLHHTGLDRIFQFAPDTMTALASIQISEEQQPGR